jgi:sugar-specific transcriptional regulator TrmB
MENILIDAGLTKFQAQAYLYLLENGAVAPSALTAKLSITRTNTYKVLDSLEKVGLAKRKTLAKKILYYPENPVALSSLIAEKRNNLISLEQNVDKAMRGLQDKYRVQKTDIEAEVVIGKESLVSSYMKQSEQRQPIYFIKSQADIPFMGYEIMDKVRKTQGKLSGNRYGITPDGIEAPKNKAIDKTTNLTRTWVNASDYTSPVEWSVSGNSLIIQVFNDQGKSIVIQSDLIAESFRQLWQITDTSLKSSPNYKNYPIKANRQN